MSKSHLMNTYARLPVAFTHGKGAWLWDSNGKPYLDALSGIAVNTLGHAHPRFTAALSTQINKLIHTSNIYQIPEQEAGSACRQAVRHIQHAGGVPVQFRLRGK